MSYCNKCGNKLNEEVIFCDKCGNKINSNNKEDNKSPVEILKKEVSEETVKPNKWIKAWDVTKKVGSAVGDWAEGVSKNMEQMDKDAKEGKGIFAGMPHWEPPKDVDPFKMDIPKGVTLDSYNDQAIFGTKQKPNKRPYIPKGLKVLIYRRDKGTCQICFKRVDSQDYNIGHDLAHSKGGQLHKNNLFVSHPLCNRSMGTKSLKEMQKIMGTKK